MAINDLGDGGDLAYLFKYDSAHGVFPGEVAYQKPSLWIDGHDIQLFAEPTPTKIPWGMVTADVVIEANRCVLPA